MAALKITGQSAAPTVTGEADAGTLYYDSDTNKLRHYNGTAWADVFPAIASADLPAGTIVNTTKSHRLSTGGHIYTTLSAATPTGLQLSTPATTGSNYNIIHWSSAGQCVNANHVIYLYCNKDSAGMAEITRFVFPTTTYVYNCVFIDTVGLTDGTNVYEIYMSTASGSFFLVHSSRPYTFTVQEIKA